MIYIDQETGNFAVRDDEAKRRDMQRMMKNLATERLKTKVMQLETQMGSFMHLDHPICVLDLDCFLQKLFVVKSWLMSKSCTIVVTTQGTYF